MVKILVLILWPTAVFAVTFVPKVRAGLDKRFLLAPVRVVTGWTSVAVWLVTTLSICSAATILITDTGVGDTLVAVGDFVESADQLTQAAGNMRHALSAGQDLNQATDQLVGAAVVFSARRDAVRNAGAFLLGDHTPKVVVLGTQTAEAGGSAPYIPPQAIQLTESAAEHYGSFDAELLQAMGHVESHWDMSAVSHAGARGALQIMPGTAIVIANNTPLDADLILTDLTSNVWGAAWYLDYMLILFDGDHDLAVMAYNGGPRTVADWVAGNRTSLPAETQRYIVKVTAAYNRLLPLYPDCPDDAICSSGIPGVYCGYELDFGDDPLQGWVFDTSIKVSRPLDLSDMGGLFYGGVLWKNMV